MKSKAGARLICAVVLASCAAAGCSGGQSDLQKWIAETKKKPGGRIQALPEVKPYETFVYAARAICARRSSPWARASAAVKRACARAPGATASSSKDSRSTR